MKAYTDLSQSITLGKFLPIESADGFYESILNPTTKEWDDILVTGTKWASPEVVIPAWSLAALLSVACTYCSRLEITLRADKKYNVFVVKDDFVFRSFDDHPDGFENLVDACVEMIEKLHEQNLL